MSYPYGQESDNLIPVKDVSATDAARRFSELIDAVEHSGESFTVHRHGRAVARITPVGSANGRAVLDLLSKRRADPGWAADIASARDLAAPQEQRWNG